MYLSDEIIESVFSVEYDVSQYADILEEMRLKNETMQDEIQESY
jgi:hypothetical protein